jgi:hypothetical protein
MEEGGILIFENNLVLSTFGPKREVVKGRLKKII